MAATSKTETSRTHPGESSFVSVVSGWAQQGVQSFFATQRVLLDLAMRQNANVMQALRQQLTDPHHSPTALLSEVAGEGMTNFIEGQKVLLDLGKQQNEILMTAVKDRVGDQPAAHAMTDLLRRSVDTFIELQRHFLEVASKQTDAWAAAAKTGQTFNGQGLADLAREGMENFVQTQRKFLDVVLEETAKAGKAGAGKAGKPTELAELARQSVDAFIDAQKKLLDTAGEQMSVNWKAARQTLNLFAPIPNASLGELTRQGVESFVGAQKALLDVMTKPRATPVAAHAKSRPVAHRAHVN